jgi:O-antigen ligase
LAGYLQFFLEFFYKLELFINKDLWFHGGSKKIIISGFFGNEKKLGSFLCRLLPITIGLYLLVSKVDNNKKIINILFFFVPLFILVFLTSERMSLIYCILTFFFICLYASRINRKNIIIFPLLIILVTSILYFSDFNRFKETIDNSYKQLFPKDKLVFFSEQHQVFSTTSIELFKKKPILGIGPNNYRRKCDEVTPDFMSKKINFDKPEIENCSTHPHNIFFQLLSETGLIGIIYYIIFNIFLFTETFKFLFNKNYDQVNFFFLLPVIYYLNPIFPSGNFFNNWYMCLGILGLPFYLYLVRIKKSD